MCLLSTASHAISTDSLLSLKKWQRYIVLCTSLYIFVLKDRKIDNGNHMESHYVILCTHNYV